MGAEGTDERRSIVERIVASKRFHRAPQLRDILVHLVAHSIQSSEPLTEQEIGAKVLGRGPDFDPAHDNIVRAQMRHLRIKLREYFENEGRDETVLLSIPKGHYIAEFTQREPKRASPPPTPPLPGPVPLQVARKRPGRRWLALLLAAITVAATLALANWRRSGKPPAIPEEYAFYSEILGPRDGALAAETSLVLGNPVVILYAGAPTRDGQALGATTAIPVPNELEERLKPAANRADLGMPFHLLQVKSNDYAGMGDASGCFYLGQLMATLSRPTSVTQSRFLSWESAMRKTLIILGSPHINKWAHGNLPNHDFTIVKMGIRNKNPKEDEPALYPCVWDENGDATSDHGLIWAWRTPSGSRVVVLAGPSSAATGAMAGLFADPDRFRPIYDKVCSSGPSGQSPANWQVLFQVEIRDNLPVQTTYLTHRVYPADAQPPKP